MYLICIIGPMATDIGFVRLALVRHGLVPANGEVEQSSTLGTSACYLVDLAPEWEEALSVDGQFTYRMGAHTVEAELP